MTNELRDYIKLVESLSKSKNSIVFDNSSSEHANIVLQNMLKTTNETFYLFDKNLAGDIASSVENGEPFYLEIQKFLIQNKKMKIIVDEPNYMNGDFYKEIKSFPKVLKDNINLYLYDVPGEEKEKFYFQFNDNNAIRVTTEDNSKAKCSFNDKKAVEYFQNSFNTILQNSKKIF